MNLLIKFPTRNRVAKFHEVLSRYQMLLSGNNNVQFIISVDTSDSHEYDCSKWNNVIVDRRDNKSKIEAINSGMEIAKKWDIVLLASDDMIPVKQGYDDVIVKYMRNLYPDRDGVLWFNDGYTGNRLNTLSILGRKYYDRFGYIYHPEYQSLWVDNEFMDVANILGKQTYIPEVIIKHEHPNNNRGVGNDAQYQHTESFYYSDREIYLKHKRNNFGL